MISSTSLPLVAALVGRSEPQRDGHDATAGRRVAEPAGCRCHDAQLVEATMLGALSLLSDAIFADALPREAADLIEPMLRRMRAGRMTVANAELIADVCDLAIDGALSDPLTILRDLASL